MPELHLLTGAYALDALDDVERKSFERHLRSCATCVVEVIEFRESAAGLADRVAAAAPEQLRARVLAEISRTRQVSPSARLSLPRPSLRRSLATAAAAVILAGGAGLGGVAWQEQRAAHQREVEAGQIARVLTDPSGFDVVGSVAGGGTAKVAVAQGTAVFAANKLAPLPDGKTYQLWLIRGYQTPGQKITSKGLLKLDNGAGQTLVSGVQMNDVVAVSVEPKGGSQQPTTTPIVGLQVT
jgi:anti-sigma-K factor RskA